MKLPGIEQAIIPEAKLAGYLLSFSHRDGRGKARFFSAFGFSATNWEELAIALKQHATAHEVSRVEESPFGARYIIEGALETPDGRNPDVRVVWFVESGEDRPRLVTAYPWSGERV